MADQNELDRLYREAQSVLKAKEYDRAVGLLTQILVIDENYKDVSRLLAQTVKLKRRRWYNHPALWSALGFVALVGLSILIFPKISSLYAAQPAPATQVINPTTTPSPTTTITPTQTLTPTPTPIPLAWKRISMGQEFPRDTVTAFATDKKDPDVIYASMENAGVYKTIDGGLSWRPAHQGLTNTQVESLLIDSQNPRILYAGTIGGVFKTEDGGENWYRIGDGTYLLMDYQDSFHFYARDENGIYETIDQGNTWKSVYVLKKNCPDEIHSWAIHPADGKTLFIGGGEDCTPGVYQSSDGGRNWTLIGMKDKSNLDAIFIRLGEQGNYSIYTLFTFVSSGLRWDEYGWYVSHNGGADWSKADIGCETFVPDLNDPSTIYCGNKFSLYVAQSGQNSWRTISGTQSKVYTALHVDRLGEDVRIIAGATNVSKQGSPYVSIFISPDNGVSWTERGNGLGSGRAEIKMEPSGNGAMYMGVYFSGVDYACQLYKSLDSGRSWLAIKKEASWCGPAFDDADTLYLMQWNALQKSWDGGDTWLWDQSSVSWNGREFFDPSLAHALPSTNRGGSQSVSANPYIKGFAYDISDVIYYSIDTGLSWQLSSGSEGSWDARLFYTDQSKMIYAIGRTHQSYSTDNGVTWQKCGKDVITSRSDSRLALDLGGSRLYLATPGQGVLISTDNCGSWQASNNGLSNLFVNTLAIDPNDPNTIYAGTDGGAYISFDGGATWGQVNDGLLGAVVVYSIVVDKDSNIYAATPYGVFKLEER